MINKVCKRFLLRKSLILFVMSFLFHIQGIHAEVIKQIHSDELYMASIKGGLKRLRAEGFVIRGNPPWPLDLPLDWGADPFKDRDWQFQLHCWRMIDQFMIEYFKTAEISLIEESLKFVEDWHDYHFIKNKSADFSWDDMATGIRALRIAFFINLIRMDMISIDKKLRQKIYFLAEQHINKLTQENFFSKNNHGIFALAGLHLLCRENFENPTCNNDTRVFIEKTFKEILDKQFTEEGVHTEGAPEYHFYISDLLDSRLKATKEISNSINSILKKAKNVEPWLVFPNKISSRVGDSRSKTYNVSFEPLKSIKPTCIEKDKCFLVGDFTKSGYAIIRTIPDSKDESMIFVTGMAHNNTHKHADELIFELFEFGRFIFIDPGTYSDEFDSMRKYVVSPAAHNTISIQEKEIPIDLDKSQDLNIELEKSEIDKYEKVTWREIINQVETVEMIGSFIKSIMALDNEFVIHGKVDRKNLFSQERYIYYIPGKKLRIEDTVLSSTEHNYVSSLHLAPDLNAILFRNNAYIDFGNGSLHAKMLSENCRLSIVRGQKDPILGWATTDKYLEMIPTNVIRAICPGKNRKIIWEVEFHRKNNNDM